MALLKLGRGGASEIARNAKVNRAETYRVLKKLQRLGLVEVYLARPKQFNPVYPVKALSNLLAHMKERITKLMNIKKEIGHWLISIMGKTSMPEVGGVRFQVIDDRNRIYDKVREMFRRAEDGISVVLSKVELPRIIRRGLDDILRSCARKGVKIKIITEIDEHNLRGVKALLNFCEIRHYDDISFHIVLIDKREIILGAANMGYPRGNMKKTNLWTNSPSLINALQVFFDQLWHDAMNAQDKNKLLKTRKPAKNADVIKHENYNLSFPRLKKHFNFLEAILLPLLSSTFYKKRRLIHRQKLEAQPPAKRGWKPLNIGR